MDQHFRVRMAGPKHMAASFQQRTQLPMVVDLAVEDDADTLVVVPHRLAAALAIDDREAPVPEIDLRLSVEILALAVRPAMRQGRGHRRQIGLVAKTCEAGDAAHVASFRTRN